MVSYERTPIYQKPVIIVIGKESEELMCIVIDTNTQRTKDKFINIKQIYFTVN